MKNYISENISYLVNKMRCSQDEFGALFDLNRSVISQYIKEKSQPKIETIQRICEYFEITIDDFINRSLEDVKNKIVNEPREEYHINKKDENKIISLLENALKDKDNIIAAKDKIIENLEEQVLYFRTGSDKSAG
jgi:transcriptional regulator with XRE-family HTH domain